MKKSLFIVVLSMFFVACGGDTDLVLPDEMHRQCKKEIVTYRTKNDNTARRVVI